MVNITATCEGDTTGTCAQLVSTGIGFGAFLDAILPSVLKLVIVIAVIGALVGLIYGIVHWLTSSMKHYKTR